MATLTAIVPMPHGLARDANLGRPFLKRQSFAFKLIQDGISAISYLSRLSGPNTVIGAVVAIIVNAFNAHPLRHLAHIRQEVLKDLPAIANPYSASAVMVKSCGIRVLASLAHVSPYMIRRRARQAVANGRAFIVKATARLCSSIAYVSAVALNNLAAIALKSPDRAAAFTAASPFKSGQSPKHHASNIEWFHGPNSTTKGYSQ